MKMKRVNQIAVQLRDVRIEFERLAIGGDRRENLPLIQEHVRQIAQDPSMPRREFECPPVTLQSFVQASLPGECHPEVVRNLTPTRIEFQGTTAGGDGRLEIPKLRERNPQVVLNLSFVRIRGERGAIHRDGLIQSASKTERRAQVITRARILWLQGEQS